MGKSSKNTKKSGGQGRGAKNISDRAVKKVVGGLGVEFSLIRIIVFCVVAVLCGLSFLFNAQLEKLINFNVNSINNDIVAANESPMRVHYLYAGQADCTIIELPDDKIMMIDCGLELNNRTENANKMMNYLDEIIFAERSSIKIDYFIITHPDYDHMAATEQILDKYAVGEVFMPQVYYYKEGDPDSESFDSAIYPSNSTATWKKTVLSIKEHAEEINFNSKDLGKVIDYDDLDDAKDYSFTFYGPVSKKYSSDNNYSPVMILKNNNKTFMFTGDAEKLAEKEVVDYVSESGGPELGELNIDVLHVGHHGSNTSSSEEFLEATTPIYAVISCGQNNSYGHPHNVTINSLTAVGASILRTDISGTIVGYISEAGAISFVLDTFDPNQYHIKWSYIVITVIIITAAVCFISRRGVAVKKKIS